MSEVDRVLNGGLATPVGNVLEVLGMSENRHFNLIYKNKETGDIKHFNRDGYRNYTAEDGTKMSKSESWTHWDFQGKLHSSNRVTMYNHNKKSLSKNSFVRAKERMRSLQYANEIGPNEKLETYLDGFMDCLTLFEGKD